VLAAGPLARDHACPSAPEAAYVSRPVISAAKDRQLVVRLPELRNRLRIRETLSKRDRGVVLVASHVVREVSRRSSPGWSPGTIPASPPMWASRSNPGRSSSGTARSFAASTRAGSGAAVSPPARSREGEEHKPRRRALPSWGRLIAKVHQVDPLVCAHCGKRMSVVAFVTDSGAIGRILEAEGWGVPQEWE